MTMEAGEVRSAPELLARVLRGPVTRRTSPPGLRPALTNKMPSANSSFCRTRRVRCRSGIRELDQGVD